MGAATSVYDKAGQLKPYPYPYHVGHKILQFPYKFHFTHGKMHRTIFYGFIWCMFVQHSLQIFLRSKKMDIYWKEKRSHYHHTFFLPPKPPTFGRH